MLQKSHLKLIILLGLGIFLLLSSCKTYVPESSNKPESFVYVIDYIPDALLDVRYYSNDNFVGSKIDGYYAPRLMLTKPAAIALSQAADNLRNQGYRVMVYDTYRPQKAVNHFLRWINHPTDAGNKSFYPNISKAQLLSGSYGDAKSGHSRGSAVDLTLLDKSGTEVDMGGVFDLFDPVSHPDNATITAEQRNNRMILRKAMLEAGFLPINSEWWHFYLKNEPYPTTYFDFDVK